MSILEEKMEEFQKIHPNVQFNISGGGAGKGMTDALSGAVDIGMVSRAIKPAEVSQGAYGVAVVKDAVFPVVRSGGGPDRAAGLVRAGAGETEPAGGPAANGAGGDAGLVTAASLGGGAGGDGGGNSELRAVRETVPRGDR